MPRSLPSSSDPAHIAGLHAVLAAQAVGQRALPHAGRSGKNRNLPVQNPPQRINPAAFLRTDKKQLRAGILVSCGKRLLLSFLRLIRLVEDDNSRDLLRLHHHQKLVQQIQVRLRAADGKCDNRLVDIGTRRTNKDILPRKNVLDVAGLFFLIQHRGFHHVPDKGLDLPAAESSLCLALQKPRLRLNIVETGDTFYNNSLHKLLTVPKPGSGSAPPAWPVWSAALLSQPGSPV